MIRVEVLIEHSKATVQNNTYIIFVDTQFLPWQLRRQFQRFNTDSGWMTCDYIIQWPHIREAGIVCAWSAGDRFKRPKSDVTCAVGERDGEIGDNVYKRGTDDHK